MIATLADKVLRGGTITGDEAFGLANLENSRVLDLISSAGTITRKYRGNRLELCSIVNGKSGNCTEDCGFCAQSSRHGALSAKYSMISPEEALQNAVAMEKAGAQRFSLVTSGRGISDRDLEKALKIFHLLKRETRLGLCASLGIIDQKKAVMLKEAGVTMYHHNLEAAPGFFPYICTTHRYEDRVDTIAAARKAGLRVCAGGIIGLGETFKQRVELALELRRLGVDSVPLNFLLPVRGTPMEGCSPPPPLELLHTLAIFRLVLPGAVIRLCGGRSNLRDIQALAFIAGADGVMIGNYLTTKGENLRRDMQLFTDLGFEIFPLATGKN